MANEAERAGSPQRASRWDQAPIEDGVAAENNLLRRESEAREAVRAAVAKRRRCETSAQGTQDAPRILTQADAPVLPRELHPRITSCDTVHNYDILNRIEEGSYGIVSRARHKRTNEVVALKQLKLEKETYGFPITSLREIHTLMEARHMHIVELKEIVVGDKLDQIYLVMEFVEHDLKTLLTTMRTVFLPSEIKTLMRQLLSAVAFMHSRWIVHRDLKTSNLLMSNRGRIKIADFGLARMFGDPLGDMTNLVVTLWYRAPELLLGAKVYDTSIDMWSVGCIFAELLDKAPIFPGKTEVDQLTRIFRLLGHPTSETWPGYKSLPLAKPKSAASSRSLLSHHFRYTTEATRDLLQCMLTYDPAKRISAEDALRHPYFHESPAPAHPDSFGSFPSVAAGEKHRRTSPHAPQRRAHPPPTYSLEFDLAATKSIPSQSNLRK